MSHSMIEIAAKFVSLKSLIKRPIHRGDESTIHLSKRVGAHRAKPPLLDQIKEPNLKLWR
jgi:hypothetical protein